MRISEPSAARLLVGITWAALMVALHAGCSDQSTERRGGDGGSDLNAGSGGQTTSGAGQAGGGAEGGVAGGSAVPIKWCDAYKIINCVCQQCHQNPTKNGAPVPLMTYQDTQPPYPLATSTKTVWQAMEEAVGNRSMPLTGDKTLVPPVQPLTDEQRTVLLSWCAEGAHDEGGTACPMTCDWSHGPPNGG